MQIIDKYLSELDYNKIKEKYQGPEVPWRFIKEANFNSSKAAFQFVYETYNMMWTDFEVPDETNLLLSRLRHNKCKKVIRSKSNLFTKRQDVIKYGWHIDIEGLDKFKTLLYYINTNNGGTEFENGGFVKSVANRAVIVVGDIKHQSVGQTDEDIRLLININFLEEPWEVVKTEV